MYLGFSLPAATLSCQSSSLLPPFKLFFHFAYSEKTFVAISYF